MATRRERVVLELEDHFTTPMAKAAAAAALLEHELDKLDRDGVRVQASMGGASREISSTGKSAARAEKDIDKFSGRLAVMRDVALTLGPGLAPLGSVGVAAVSGLASQFGFTVAAAGTMVLAFQDVGTALDALNKARLEPTVQNLEAAEKALNRLSPAAQGFVVQLEKMAPEFDALRDSAAEGLFPGLTRGLQDAETALPRVHAVVSAISTELGAIGADLGGAIASGRADDFLDFLAREAPQALHEMAQAAGNTAHALAELWMATTPLNRDFSKWLVDATENLDEWASSLSETEGFQEFLDYVRSNGPQVGETIESVANALLQVVEAGAPLGGPVLKALEAVADVIAAIADSNLGTPIVVTISAMAALNRAAQLYATLQKQTWGAGTVRKIRAQADAISTVTSAQDRARMSATELMRVEQQRQRRTQNVLKGGAALAGIAVASSGIADSMGLANTASLTLMGTLAGPFGAAAGFSAGALLDAKAAGDKFSDSLDRINQAAKDNNLDALNAELLVNQQILADLASNAGGAKDAWSDFMTDVVGGNLASKVDRLLPGVGGLFGDVKTGADRAAENVARARNAMEDAARAQSALAGVTKTSTAAAADFTLEQKRQAAAMEESRDAALKQADGFVGLGKDVDNAKLSLAGWMKQLEEQAIALEQFTANVQKAAKRGLDEGLIASLEAAGPAGALRMKELANATDKEIARANRAWKRGQDAANRYADTVAGIPNARIDVNINPALAKIEQIKRALRGLPRSISTDYYVNQVNSINKPRVEVNRADGGTIPGQRAPYGDKVLAMLAPGEEVISNRNGQADRWRPFLKAINGGGMADGGTVATRFSPSAVAATSMGAVGAPIDYDRLAAAVSGDRLLGYRGTRDAMVSAMRTALSEMPVQRVSRDVSMTVGVS